MLDLFSDDLPVVRRIIAASSDRIGAHPVPRAVSPGCSATRRCPEPPAIPSSAWRPARSVPAWRRPGVDGPDGVDGVGVGGALVGAGAQDPGEAEGEAARV